MILFLRANLGLAQACITYDDGRWSAVEGVAQSVADLLQAVAEAALAIAEQVGLKEHPESAVAHLVLAQLHDVGGNYDDLGWLWSTMAALASGEGRYDSALLLAGAAAAVAERNGPHFSAQLHRKTLAWLERARAQVGPIRARELTAQGSRLTPDELLRAALEKTDLDRDVPLSPRELEIAELVARGLTNQEIAQQPIISTRTVESHVNNMKTKLGLSRRAHIVAWALGRELR